ncbi:MAG: hypothetical protein D6B25_06365 [Desulfobulbaceae bacterium]|nr:MAG: hypothetical protein D6B25_06365 [Desulfobulbaceae bacterium]
MDNTLPKSPLIQSSGWGKMEVETVGSGKDFKLWPGGGRAWDWNQNGTNHGDGIQPAELDELISHGCKIIVLTRGVLFRLRVPRKTLDYARENNIELIIEGTPKGIKKYNGLASQYRPVGGLFHSTC